MKLGRRQACLGAGALLTSIAAPSGARSADCAFEERVLEVPGERLARRCRLLVPRGSAPPRRVLVLLHGLGETTSEELGISAWTSRYGLCSAYERLRKPPVTRTLPDARYLSDERLLELNRELEARPFRGFALACPFTPDVHRAGPTSVALDRYAAWLSERLLPALRRELGAQGLLFGLDGVSLGGFVALEVLTRRPAVFASVGSLQGAFGKARAESYAARIERAFAEHGARPLRLGSSRADPYRAANELLAAQLRKRDIEATLSVPPGPHDQRFLREAGTLELLLWHDRALAEGAG